MYFSSKLRKATLGAVMLAGALGGMPMKPEEIEELLQAHNRDEIVQVMDAEEPDDDPADRYKSQEPTHMILRAGFPIKLAPMMK